MVLAISLPPGSVDPGFGDVGFTGIQYNARLGATRDDSGPSIRIVCGDLSGGACGQKWILVAGLAGKYAEITRLKMDGQIDRLSLLMALRFPRAAM